MTPEHKKKISETLKAKGIKPKIIFKAFGKDNPMFGKRNIVKIK